MPKRSVLRMIQSGISPFYDTSFVPGDAQLARFHHACAALSHEKGSGRTSRYRRRARENLARIYDRVSPDAFILCCLAVGYKRWSEESEQPLITNLATWWATIEPPRQLLRLSEQLRRQYAIHAMVVRERPLVRFANQPALGGSQGPINGSPARSIVSPTEEPPPERASTHSGMPTNSSLEPTVIERAIAFPQDTASPIGTLSDTYEHSPYSTFDVSKEELFGFLDTLDASVSNLKMVCPWSGTASVTFGRAEDTWARLDMCQKLSIDLMYFIRVSRTRS